MRDLKVLEFERGAERFRVRISGDQALGRAEVEGLLLRALQQFRELKLFGKADGRGRRLEVGKVVVCFEGWVDLRAPMEPRAVWEAVTMTRAEVERLLVICLQQFPEMTLQDEGAGMFRNSLEGVA